MWLSCLYSINLILCAQHLLNRPRILCLIRAQFAVDIYFICWNRVLNRLGLTPNAVIYEYIYMWRTASTRASAHLIRWLKHFSYAFMSFPIEYSPQDFWLCIGFYQFQLNSRVLPTLLNQYQMEVYLNWLSLAPFGGQHAKLCFSAPFLEYNSVSVCA